MADGFLLVDKPAGWTSHDVVAKCRGLLGQKKVGHAGTLDPMATGLLVLGLGRATRLLRYIQEGTKHYDATVAFGIATDTLDADGAILERTPMGFTRSDLVAAAQRFVGDIRQVPPMVSAIKVDGRRLYELAREGREVEREARSVRIESIEVGDVGPGPYPEAEVSIRCGSGTYVRSLADDIARALGGRAHLTALRRTAIEPHLVDDARTIEQLSGDVHAAVIDMAAGLQHLPAVTVDGAQEVGVGNGVVFAAQSLGADRPGSWRVLDAGGRLLAVYRVDDRKATPEVVVA